MRLLLILSCALAVNAQSLVTAYVGLTAEQLAAIERNGKDYDQAGNAASARGEALSKELQREITASPLNVVRLDILHTERVMLRRERDRREAALVAANQALLTPAQVEKVHGLEQGESLGHSFRAAIRAAIIVDPCAEAITSAEISPELIEHLGLDGSLLQQLKERNAGFTQSLADRESQHSNNSYRISNITRAPEIDVEELGRLYAAQIAINREIAERRKRHTVENRALLAETVLEKLQRLETIARLESTLGEARDLHLLTRHSRNQRGKSDTMPGWALNH
ncbi:MAG: hypothetical protein FJW38_24845 [Acidobacteria bacterium]|nr:hypothetical protein [Acidobacteriota bacterium]